MQKNDFIEYYKALPTVGLLEILSNKNDYQLPAIEAAQQEIDRRNISENELEEAKQQLLEKTIRKENQKQKIADAEIKLKRAVNRFADNVNPIQKEKPTPEKLIKTIAIVYGGVFLFQLIRDFKTNLYIMRDIARYPVSSIISLAPLVLIPVASALFFIKKRSGWILLTGCVTFLTISIGLLFVKSLNYSSRSYGELHSMFPRPSLMSLLIPLAILISTLFFVQDRSKRNL